MTTFDELFEENSDLVLKHFYDPSDYDPQAAHEYYLRNRQLKGRTKAAAPVSKGRRTRGQVSSRHKPHKVVPQKSAAQRRKEVEARVASLQDKLAHLRAVLANLVKQAKARSGVETPDKESKKDSKDSSSKEPSKLTPQQRKEAAQRSKDWREKNKDSPDEQAQKLEEQIAAIEQKIKDMKAELALARSQSSSSKSSSVGARATNNK